MPDAAVLDSDSDLTVHEAFAGPNATAPFEGIIGVEGLLTGDGRLIAADSLEWATFPLPLRWASQDFGGHDGAVVVGRIDRIERRDNGDIYAWGVLDLGSKDGRECARLMRGQFLSGVSMDLDSVDAFKADVNVFNEDGSPQATTADVLVTQDARVRAATIVSIPAFDEARLALVASMGAGYRVAVGHAAWELTFASTADELKATTTGRIQMAVRDRKERQARLALAAEAAKFSPAARRQREVLALGSFVEMKLGHVPSTQTFAYNPLQWRDPTNGKWIDMPSLGLSKWLDSIGFGDARSSDGAPPEIAKAKQQAQAITDAMQKNDISTAQGLQPDFNDTLLGLEESNPSLTVDNNNGYQAWSDLLESEQQIPLADSFDTGDSAAVDTGDAEGASFDDPADGEADPDDPQLGVDAAIAALNQSSDARSMQPSELQNVLKQQGFDPKIAATAVTQYMTPAGGNAPIDDSPDQPGDSGPSVSAAPVGSTEDGPTAAPEGSTPEVAPQADQSAKLAPGTAIHSTDMSGVPATYEVDGNGNIVATDQDGALTYDMKPLTADQAAEALQSDGQDPSSFAEGEIYETVDADGDPVAYIQSGGQWYEGVGGNMVMNPGPGEAPAAPAAAAPADAVPAAAAPAAAAPGSAAAEVGALTRILGGPFSNASTQRQAKQLDELSKQVDDAVASGDLKTAHKAAEKINSMMPTGGTPEQRTEIEAVHAAMNAVLAQKPSTLNDDGTSTPAALAAAATAQPDAYMNGAGTAIGSPVTPKSFVVQKSGDGSYYILRPVSASGGMGDYGHFYSEEEAQAAQKGYQDAAAAWKAWGDAINSGAAPAPTDAADQDAQWKSILSDMQANGTKPKDAVAALGGKSSDTSAAAGPGASEGAPDSAIAGVPGQNAQGEDIGNTAAKAADDAKITEGLQKMNPTPEEAADPSLSSLSDSDLLKQLRGMLMKGGKESEISALEAEAKRRGLSVEGNAV